MRRVLIPLFASLWLIAAPATAAPLSLAALQREVEAGNAELVALRQRAAAAEARVGLAGVLPDPKLSGEWMDATQPLAARIQLTQMVMIPGKLDRMVAMEAQMARMARFEYEARRWMITAEVQGAYFDLYNLDQQQAINRDSQNLLKDMIRVTNARYAVGQGTQADVLRPQLQLTKLINDQLENTERIQSVWITLNGLRGADAGGPQEVPEGVTLTPVTAGRDELLRLAEQGPMVQMAAAELERYRAALELAQLGYLPDFELGAGLAPGSGMNAGPTVLFMAGVNLPVWYAQKQDKQVAEAQKALEAAQARLAAKKREVAAQVGTLLAQIARMEQQLKLLEEGMVPQARIALKANLAAYQAGRGDYLMLLDSFMALYDNRMRAAMLLADHEKMVAMLEAQLARSLKGPRR